MSKAVFLDRDGVLNKIIYRTKYNEYGPPHLPEEIEIISGVFESLRSLLESAFILFVVSNQPDYAKGKISYEKLISVCDKFKEIMDNNKIFIKEYYYCFHHPDGVVNDFNIKCQCRKPETLFIEEAIKKYDIDRNKSWFIGDRDSDVRCGKNANLKTIFINSGIFKFQNDNQPDFIAKDIYSATNIILNYIYE